MNEIARSRLSGEPIEKSSLLLDLESAPLPGIYVDSSSEAPSLRSHLRIVQSDDGLVQTNHRLPEEVYRKYGFAAGANATYAGHLQKIADRVARNFDKSSCILEVGCGDGTLLAFLFERGFNNLVGIDPSPQAGSPNFGGGEISMGFFPHDLPKKHAGKRYDLIICRHVLEHIETPHEFVSAMCGHLAAGGQILIEVPDICSTLEKRWWTNFYALHCNYFEESTLDILMSTHGLRCTSGEVVDVFGGSLLRFYEEGFCSPTAPRRWNGHFARLNVWTTLLADAAESLPDRTWGWGAAERTASTFAFCPPLYSKLCGIVDGNNRIHGKIMAGTELKIYPTEKIPEITPACVVVFALSYSNEIVEILSKSLPKKTMILIPTDPIQRLVI
jgi:SAM-dependent methyltransferase